MGFAGNLQSRLPVLGDQKFVSQTVESFPQNLQMGGIVINKQ